MQKKNLELYLHIPFCVRKCNYCDFLSASATPELIQNYTEALCNQIRGASYLTQNYKITTVFFGGGTPSILTADQFRMLMAAVRESFLLPVGQSITGACDKQEDCTKIKAACQEAMADCPEITVECNPGMLSEALLQAFCDTGVNRLSIGLQSADNAELKTLGRIHSYDDFLTGYRLARRFGFQNINIDLMRTLPGQTAASWKDSLTKVLALEPEHLSIYSLILEEGTRFYEWYHGKPEKLPSEEAEQEIDRLTGQLLNDAGYEQYEISNYAKPGFACRHNIGYWTGEEYLGLGLGASSLITGVRFRQTDRMQEYMQEYFRLHSRSMEESKSDQATRENNCSKEQLPAAVTGKKYREMEQLSQKEQMEEFMFLGLRMTQGISKERFSGLFGCGYDEIYGAVTGQLCEKKLLQEAGDRVRLTNRGRDISNVVLAEFLLDE